jgi:hypothetical protein
MNVVSIFQVQEQIPEATALSLSSGRIGASSFANTSEALHQISTGRILEQVGLDRVENVQSQCSG